MITLQAFVEKTRRVVTTTKKKQNAAERKERDAYVERYDARLEQLATENDARAAEESARKKDLVEGRREEEAAIRDRFSTLGSVKAEVQPGGLHASGAFFTLVPIRPRSRCERRSLRTSFIPRRVFLSAHYSTPRRFRSRRAHATPFNSSN